MSRIRAFTYILCLVLLLLVMISCDGEKPKTTTTEVAQVETTVATTEVEPICIAGGESAYLIVRAEVPSDTVKDVCIAFRHDFVEAFGQQIMIGTDWVRRGEEPPAMADEILVGPTNRQESIELAQTLAEGTYRIKVFDRRIVVCAASDWMLEYAIEEFLAQATQDTEGRWVIPSDLDVTGDLSDYARPGWALEGLPAYDGGDLSAGSLREPLHFHVLSARSRVQCVRRTTRAEFDAYLEKVKTRDFTVMPVTDQNGIYAVRLERDDLRAYAYLTEKRGEVRIVTNLGDDTPLEQFNYTYDKKPGDTTVLYQFGLVMDKDGIDFAYNGNKRLNCGHMYFMKLADNSIVVIDGGGIQQMSDQTANELLRLFREVTGTPAGQKVRIAGWFISHHHPDHYNGFVRFLNIHHDQVELERIFYNFTQSSSDMDRIRNLLGRYYSGILYHKPHTGETIQLADVSFDVVYTLEDQINAATGAIESSDFNDTSTVLRINFDGISHLQLGDAAGNAERVMLYMYEKEMLQCDILQVAHHGWNDLSSLYGAISPAIALYPQSSGGALKGLNGNAAKVLARVRSCAGALYFAGDETVGVSVVDGVPTVTYRAPIVGIDYNGWGFDK